jgi:hypothetical protein
MALLLSERWKGCFPSESGRAASVLPQGASRPSASGVTSCTEVTRTKSAAEEVLPPFRLQVAEAPHAT